MRNSCRILVVTALSAMTSGAFCQTPERPDTLNLDFEYITMGEPIRWGHTEGVSIDSSQSYSGKYSVLLEGDDNQNKVIWTVIPNNNYEGKTITFSGYVKTEEVTDGYGYLWMRLDPDVAFDNMQDRGITGTTDWTRYEITLPFDAKKTTGIFVAGGLAGKGKMWLDDVSILIDGKDLRTLRPLRPAGRDTVEFADGSHITDTALNKTRIKNLRDLGRIWGFLKYYHPAVTEGNYNWDYELFRVLPQVIRAKNKAERDAVFIGWINRLGRINVTVPGNTDTPAALDWIEKSGFSPELTALLREIQNAWRGPNSYYVDIPLSTVFQNEQPYASMKYPDAGYRLLSLYRYWNMVQYFYPYKDIIGENWEDVLEKYIPRIMQAGDEEAYLFTMLELAARIHDSHGLLWTATGRIWNRYYGHRQAVPKVDFIRNKAVVTAFYNDSLHSDNELQVGDVITRINGESVKSIVKSRLPITEGSNYPTLLRNIARQILRCNDETIGVTFVRDGRSMETSLKTYSIYEIARYFKITPPTDTCFKMLTPEIGYVYTEFLKDTYFPALWKAVKDTKGLIIDLRCNSSGNVQYGLGVYMIPQPTEFAKFSVGNTVTPGEFTFMPPFKIGIFNKDYYKGKVVVLVNELSQSNLEYAAMALSRIPNVVTIGSTTAGADGEVSHINLPGGIKTMITGRGVFYPDGGQTQRIGIRIDEVVKPTIEGVKAGRDEVLERAVEIINRKSSQKSTAGSGFKTCPVDTLTLKNLEVLCRVWGFVKYYHPCMSDSTVDMDAELFGLLPQVANVNAAKRNARLAKWIDGLGGFYKNESSYLRMLDTLDYETSVDFGWIGDQQMLGKKLSRKLTDLRYAERDSNHYISYVFPRGNLKFKHEKDYPDVSDCGYRLLALFRYWNVIEYFFPYKPLMDKPWDQVLKEYLPAFILSDKEKYHATVARMSTELDDTHAITNAGRMFDWRSVRIDLGVIENKLIVLSSDRLTENGEKRLLPGDEILQINGMPIDSVKVRIARYLAHSNQSSFNSLVRYYSARPLRGTNTVQIRYLRNSETKDTTIVVDNRMIAPNIKQQPYELLNDSIGYIYAGKFDYKIKDDLIETLKNTKGIIVDLRCYPSAFMVYPFIHEWLLNDSLPVASFSNPLSTMPGYYAKRTLRFGTSRPNYYRGKIVVLVNDRTMSQAEYTTMALQANPRTTVIGSQTNGADGNVSFFQLPGEINTAFSGMAVYYPDGTPTQRIGVRIDEVVEPTIGGIKTGRDEVLERAIEIIKEK